MNLFRTTLLAAALAAATPLAAHEGHVHKVMGTVASVDTKARHLDVKGTDGKTVDVVIDDKTKIERGTSPAPLDQVAVGSRVVVHYMMEHGGTNRAVEVKLPAAPAR